MWVENKKATRPSNHACLVINLSASSARSIWVTEAPAQCRTKKSSHQRTPWAVRDPGHDSSDGESIANQIRTAAPALDRVASVKSKEETKLVRKLGTSPVYHPYDGQTT